jgi:diguanylate cyclase (GGDEF)-like protein
MMQYSNNIEEKVKETTVTQPEESHSSVGATTACIVLIYGGDLGRRFPLTETTVIGRDETNGIPVDIASVSRRHAQLGCTGSSWWVVDLSSTNGTFHNGREVVSTTQLANGDILKLGGAIFKFIAGGNIEAHFHEEIHRLTILDGLTGVHNRRYLMEFLDREIARSQRHGRPLALAMLDIDYFKKINDVHGHVAGDHVLQSFAQLVSRVVRKDELFARYGGEEFVVVLPESEGDQVLSFCERIRQLVEEHTIEFDNAQIPLTISIGAASNRPSYTATDLIAAADDQLYRAKKGGRNRVCIDLLPGSTS